MNKMFDLDYETREFKPTVEWMKQRYAEANEKLFGMQLGECELGIFTTGKGSRGNTNGWFRLSANNLYIDRYNRRLYKLIGTYRENVNRENFVKITKPVIELNGNKSGSEWAFMVTLVHEMCHYYNYMNGHVPAQSHGSEFMAIAHEVTRRSNGQIEVTKKTTLERMQHFVLDDKINKMNKKRTESKLARTIAVVIFKINQTRLVLTTSEKLIHEIVRYESERNDTIQITRSNDAKLINTLINLYGYRSLMRTYKYWNITNNKELIDFVLNAEGKELYENPDLSDRMPNVQKLSANVEEPQNQPKRIFSIKTSTGTFEYDGTVYAPLFKALKERFPKMSDEAIKKIMNNPANYKVMESRKKSFKEILRETIENYIKSNNGDIPLTPDMNLSDESPLE